MLSAIEIAQHYWTRGNLAAWIVFSFNDSVFFQQNSWPGLDVFFSLGDLTSLVCFGRLANSLRQKAQILYCGYY